MSEQDLDCESWRPDFGRCCRSCPYWAVGIRQKLEIRSFRAIFMIKSEIDDIFASKGKAKVIQPIASSSNTAPEKKRKKEKKKKKRRDGGGDEVPVPEGKSNTKKRPAPETVVDPSTNLSSVKKAKVAMAVPQNAAKPKARQKDAARAREDEVRFKDSRGNGPRMSTSLLFGIRHESDSPSGLGRKTEEGFLIFKEDELGIGDEGGGETNSLNLTVIAYFVHLNIQTHHCVHSTVNVVSLATR